MPLEFEPLEELCELLGLKEEVKNGSVEGEKVEEKQSGSVKPAKPGESTFRTKPRAIAASDSKEKRKTSGDEKSAVNDGSRPDPGSKDAA